MPKISDIQDTQKKGLDISGLPWLVKAVGAEFTKGGTNLVSGPPSIGKTTLLFQLLGELSQNGTMCLYLTTEQSLADVQRSIRRIFQEPTQALLDNFYIDAFSDLTKLPELLHEKILSPSGIYNGCEVIAIDSLQGAGLSGQGGEKYRTLLSFIGSARSSGITLFLVNQLTKAGGMAGPKALEHEVDCVLEIRRTSSLRLLFVPKNRFGPSRLDPVVLVMEENGLKESPHAMAIASTALGYCGHGEFSEAQASVTIPKYGISPGLNAPYLPGRKVRQLLKVIGAMKDIDVADFSYDISCYLPGENGYDSQLDLPIVVALLSSYTQQPVDDNTLFIGEVDLTGQIRPPSKGSYLHDLAEIIRLHPGKIKRVYLAEQAVEELTSMRVDPDGPPIGEVVEVRGVRDLDNLVDELWGSPSGEVTLSQQDSELHNEASLLA